MDLGPGTAADSVLGTKTLIAGGEIATTMTGTAGEGPVFVPSRVQTRLYRARSGPSGRCNPRHAALNCRWVGPIAPMHILFIAELRLAYEQLRRECLLDRGQEQ